MRETVTHAEMQGLYKVAGSTERSWRTGQRETSVPRAFAVLDNFRRFDDMVPNPHCVEYRVVEITTTSEPFDPEAPTPEPGTGPDESIRYDVEGFYGDLDGQRRWKVWQSADSLPAAVRLHNAYEGMINPRTRDRTSPTAARMRRALVRTVVIPEDRRPAV